MLASFRRTRQIKRYHRIVSVLARHGFGSFLENLEVGRYFPLSRGIFKQKVGQSHLTPAEHLRLALEELGPTFIKLGQILSTRPDLFPPQFIVELSKLQDGVPPTSWEAVHRLIQDEYQRPLDQIFKDIDLHPLGSASLAQVHAAHLLDGTPVVIKVQRPNITRTINADLDILTDLASLAQRTAWGQLYNPVEIVAHFAFTLHNELDYRREGLNADRFRSNFAGEEHLYIPKVYWDYSTARLLVLERLSGIKIDDLDGLTAAGYDRHQVALTSAGIIAKEIIEDGFFHADPHPGNFLIVPGREPGKVVIGAMDFGMAGHISKVDRLNLLQAYNLASKLDSRGLVEHLLRMGAINGQVDMQALERDLDRLMNQYRGLPLKYIQTRRVVEELMQVAFHYRISLPPDLWLLFKTLTMMDGLARRIDPDVDILAVFEPHVRRIVLEMRLPWVWGPTFMNDLEALGLAMKDLPNIGESVLRGLQRGQLPFSLSVGANRQTLDSLDRMSTRISLSVLVAAFILGLALLFPLATANRIALVLVVLGFLAALSLGVWLVFSIIRTGK